MSLADHIRYLERRLAGFVPEALHREQRVAYGRAIDAARGAASEAAYLEATSDLVELMRAEWIDRYTTAARFYDGIGDVVRAAIATDTAEAARVATDHRQLISAMVATKQASASRRQGFENAAALIPALFHALVALRTEPDDDAAAERAAEVAAIWRDMSAGDPELTLESLFDTAPYRHRLPFDAAGVAVLVDWLGELDLETAGLEPDEPPAPFELDIPEAAGPATAAAIAAPYRAVAATLDPDDPELEPQRALYRRIDELAATADDGNALLAAMAEADLFVALAREPLLADARDARAALPVDHSATRAHYDRFVDALEAASSVAEIELRALAAEEHLAVESTWSQLLFSTATLAAVAAVAYDVERSPARREHLRRCEAVVGQLLGGSTAALLAEPVIAAMFEREIFEAGQDVNLDGDDSDPVVRRGDRALAVAGRVRGAIAQWAIAQSLGAGDPLAAIRERLAARRFATAADMRAHVEMVIAELGLPRAPGPRALEMWGTPLVLGDLANALNDPPRPALPL